MATGGSYHERPRELWTRIGTFWQRAAAAAFDAILLHGLTLASNALAPGKFALYVSLGIAPVTWAYEVGTTARWGQTLGKMFLGVQVTRVDGEKIEFWRALLRSAVAITLGCTLLVYEVRLAWLVPPEIVDAIPLKYIAVFAEHFDPGHRSLVSIVWLIAAWDLAELFTMLLHPRRRAVHDLIAGTIVVQTDRAAVRRPAERALRVIPVLLVFGFNAFLDAQGAHKTYSSRFPDGTLRGEYVPMHQGNSTLAVYWNSGSVRHLLAVSATQTQAGRHLEKTWQSFDESGTMRREVRF